MTITFIVHDCKSGGHAAWAYLDNISLDLPHTVVSSTATSTVTLATTTTITGATATTSTIGTSATRFTSYSTTTAGGTVTESVTDLQVVYVYLLVIASEFVAAVGGLIESANKLSMLAPCLALLGIAGAVIVVAVSWKKRKN